MAEIIRKVSEVIAICSLEPELKNIFVEGLSDKLVIDNFLEDNSVSDCTVFEIGDIDFSDIPNAPSRNNKDKVIFLSQMIEKEIETQASSHTLCIVDLDADWVLNKKRTSPYLSYTDYNSLELYLFKETYIARLLSNTFRIAKKIDIPDFMASIHKVCRQLFYIHCILEPYCGNMVDTKKDLSFEKNTFSCTLDIDSYWTKTMQTNKMTACASEKKQQFDSYCQNHVDDCRMEIKGHDFIHILYECVRKYKHVDMSEEEMANTFWVYLNNAELCSEPLFSRILSL